MRRIYGMILGCLMFAAVKVAAQTEQCYENAGLKEKQTISFVVLSGGKVEGTFKTSGYDGGADGEMSGFFGTKKGGQITVSFADGAPYELPPKTKTIIWKLAANALKVPMYGKNYDTNKFAAYTAAFEKCQ